MKALILFAFFIQVILFFSNNIFSIKLNEDFSIAIGILINLSLLKYYDYVSTKDKV